jgi:ribosomal-protein-alanine N-acetyltransferase
MAFGWVGEKVRLVPLERERHFDNCVRWMNDPEVTNWTIMGDLPLTRVQEEGFFKKVESGAEDMVVFAIELLETEEHIGVTGVHDIRYRHGTAETGTLIGRKALHGRGLGTDTVAVRTRYAFEVLGLRLLTTHVMAGNEASLRALLKNGYQQCGVLPEWFWKRGAFHDAILLSLRREDWRKRQVDGVAETV